MLRALEGQSVPKQMRDRSSVYRGALALCYCSMRWDLYVFAVSSPPLGETLRLTRALFPFLLVSSEQVVTVAPELTGHDPQMYLLPLTSVTSSCGERD